MKLVNSVAVPTTKLEKLALKNLKYDCIEKKIQLCHYLCHLRMKTSAMVHIAG